MQNGWALMNLDEWDRTDGRETDRGDLERIEGTWNGLWGRETDGVDLELIAGRWN